MIDIPLLHVLRTREGWDKMHRAVPTKSIEALTAAIIEDFRLYYKEFPEHQKVDYETFYTWFFSFRHPGTPEDQKPAYQQILQRALTVPEDTTATEALRERLVVLALADRITTALEGYRLGQEVNLPALMRSAYEAYQQDTDRKVKTPIVETHINDLLQLDVNKWGFTMPVESLRMHMRPMRPGDFGIVAGRPDSGKTSFLTACATHWARELPKLYPSEYRPIIWLNNEGPGGKIKLRLHMAAMAKTLSQLIAMMNAGVDLQEEFGRYIGGNPHNILVIDVHGFWEHEIEELIDQLHPSVVIFDMIDHIRFGGELVNAGNRTDQILEQMYDWGRQTGVRKGFLPVATSQISADGEGLAFPGMGMLKDSKTGKQGACEWQLMIGKTSNPDQDNLRFLGLPKNKLSVEGMPKDPRATVMFHQDSGMYYDYDVAPSDGGHDSGQQPPVRREPPPAVPTPPPPPAVPAPQAPPQPSSGVPPVGT